MKQRDAHEVKQFIACAAAALCAASVEGKATAGNGVFIEAVSNYSGACNGSSTLQNPITDAKGFRDELTLNSPWHGGFASSGSWFDSAVYTSDFYDPDRTLTYDSDTSYFDRSGHAFSYYAGHGAAGAGDTCWSAGRCYNYYQPCTSAAQCTSPTPGSSAPAVCRRDPGDYSGYCSYTAYDRTILLQNCTSGPPNRNGAVNYSTGNVKWGEAPAAGAWGGAGTNGGTNVVVLAMSHPHRSSRPQELYQAFAGVELILSPLIHWGDTSMVATRGYWFAKQAENPYASVASAYLAGAASLPVTNSCSNSAGTVNYGGGNGVNGCGGSVALTMDSSYTYTQSNLARNFINIQNDAYKSYGNAWSWYNYSCNYDCNTWSMALP